MCGDKDLLSPHRGLATAVNADWKIDTAPMGQKRGRLNSKYESSPFLTQGRVMLHRWAQQALMQGEIQIARRIDDRWVEGLAPGLDPGSDIRWHTAHRARWINEGVILRFAPGFPVDR